jgi:L-fuconate dehydratase
MVIKNLLVKDIRFPTSLHLDGSDAMNPNPDYSATYVILETDSGMEGHGLTFTIGRGNEICVEAVKSLAYLVKGKSADDFFDDMGSFWRLMTSDSQLRWLGPEKGVIHLATAAIVNAMWDLYAKKMKKPVWKLLVDMTPSELVQCIDFRYISDALTREEAIDILQAMQSTKSERELEILKSGYPAYITSVGWLGYSDEKIRHLCKKSLSEGWVNFKAKVGTNLNDDIRRLQIIREEIGEKNKLMIDANQVWDVQEAINNMKVLSRFNPLWIEEPTSPDDILGHARISKEISPIGVATGEHCHNRVMFKQLFQANAIRYCQLDAARLGGLNEVLSVVLMAKKFNIPICPHAGGVGLCEYVQHISIFDFIAVSGELNDRYLEYVDHLHEHFVNPVHVSRGRYLVPKDSGYSVQIKQESLKEFEFPNGGYWSNYNKK